MHYVRYNNNMHLLTGLTHTGALRSSFLLTENMLYALCSMINDYVNQLTIQMSMYSTPSQQINGV